MSEKTMLYDNQVATLKFLTDPHVTVFADLGSKKSNYLFINATRTGAERHYTVHSTRKADAIDCLISDESRE